MSKIARRAGIAFAFAAVAAFLFAACLATPTIEGRVEFLAGTLSPLTPDRASLVRISAADASATVLAHERETGWPDEDIAWAGGGCVLLAWLERHPMSFAPVPDPPSAVYLVRLVDNLAGRATWVMVDASTGEIGATIGDALPSSCGVPDA